MATMMAMKMVMKMAGVSRIDKWSVSVETQLPATGALFMKSQRIIRLDVSGEFGMI